MDSLLFRVSLRASPSACFAPSSASRATGSCISLQHSNHQSSKVIRGSHGVTLQGRLLNRHIESNFRGPVFFLSQKKFCINAISKHTLEPEPDACGSKSAWTEIQTSLDVFYRFTRPHTIIGTALSIISVSLLAVESLSDLSPVFLVGLLEAVVAALFMNIYIVGLNQLFDIEIDQVNKPNLPLASGEYAVRTGVAIVSTFGVLSFIIAWAVHSWPLFWALFISFVLGTAYSINLPFLRWKRFALVAAMCILAVRAVIVQLAFFLHMQTFVFQRPANFSKPLVFATGFMSFFSVVIALFKDIPDIDGDRIFGIQSFSVRLGQKSVFWTCIYLLEMAYCVAVMMGVASSCVWSKVATVLGHIILAVILWTRAQAIDLKSKAAITSFYMFIWKLFYAEYLLIPLVR
ncbi:probable homogentisate phytyltransferase 1, chloroplastic isoform X1 [Aristolochia californica]|uniref:probable homogentisate phytyltransferase 1, chloroplastic isoform X1 n=1 Tax=Aristolochia californica TaxID=171875 RepID=UPI0035DBC253